MTTSQQETTMKKLKVTLKRSTIGSTRVQKETVKGLGLRKLHGSRVLDNTPAVRGMVKRVIHLVDVQELEA